MSKAYKKKRVEEETTPEVEEVISKKELYDLNKQKKLAIKEKHQKKNKKKKTKNKKTYQMNLGARIFAIVMLILMIGSIVASIGSHFMS